MNDWQKKMQGNPPEPHVPLINVFVFGPIDGFNDPCKDGSYVRLCAGTQTYRISRGQAEVLIAELMGILGKPNPINT